MFTLCSAMPVVCDSGSIVSGCRAKLVPKSMGKWYKLMGNNPWVAERVFTLSPAYMKVNASGLAGEKEDELKLFVINGLGAVDIPKLRPPNASLPAVSSPIEEEKVVLLLEWIEYLRVNDSLPNRFKTSIMEGKWLRTHLGYQSPNMSFLYNIDWLSAGVEQNDLSFIDTTYYSKPLVAFKSALKEIGVAVEFEMGCEVVAKHLQMHTNFNAINRLYKCLYRFHWRPSDMSSVKIWIPLDGGLAGEWKNSQMCVVHDDNGLFYGRLQILEKFYEAELLPFFNLCLGVSLHPRIEDYCNLWLDWILSNHPVTEQGCCSVWRNILKHWSHSPSTIKSHLRLQGLKFPAETSSGHIQLCAPNATFIPDDLSLKELFKRTSTRIKFAWHPNPSDPEIPLDLLFSMYESLGARKISQAVEKKEVSVSNDISLHKLQAGEGLFRKGLYRIVLGYLAYPSFKLSPDKRHQIVRALLGCSAYEATKSFTVVYALTVMTEDGEAEYIKAPTLSPVRWEKDNKRILILKSDPLNQKAKVSLATEFAEVVSKGLLSEHPDLVAGLCEMLRFGCILGFNEDLVNDMLQHKNLQLFNEDESFLSQYFPDEKFAGSSSWGGTNSFETSTRPVKTPQGFSPDFLEGWENRMQIFKQAIDNMKDCTSSSLKMKLVRLLFHSVTSDEGQPGSSSDFYLTTVMGDACLKMIVASEVLGAHETSQIVPFKLDNLLSEEVLELGKCFVRGGITEQPSSSFVNAIADCDFEMLKAIAGAATLKF